MRDALLRVGDVVGPAFDAFVEWVFVPFLEMFNTPLRWFLWCAKWFWILAACGAVSHLNHHATFHNGVGLVVCGFVILLIRRARIELARFAR